MKLLIYILVVPCLALTVSAATFTVINTNDSGAGSFRQAILDSNATAATNAIAFNIPGSGVRVIKLLSALPSMTRAVTIDGFTQPGASANTLSNGNNANWLIQLDDGTAGPNGSGLRLGARHILVRGLRISNFSGYGIEVNSDSCSIAGCFVYGNQLGGIQIDEDDLILVGGTAPEDRNVISGNFGAGVVLSDDGDLNRLVGNFIGTDIAGTGTFGNQGWGIHIVDHVVDTQIGGVLPSEGNVIAFNVSGGVRVESFLGENNSIRGNRIFSNGGLAIDLGFIPGVTVNDSGDTDRLQNFPLITNAVIGSTTATIQGSLNSRSNTQFALDFYANTECDPSGYGEGESYLGNASVTTDANGNANFQVVLPTSQQHYLAVTATDPLGNTSEFSPCQLATFSGGTFTVVNTNDSGAGSLRQAVLDSNGTNSGTNRIIFNIPGSGLQVIRLQSALPVITESVTIDGFTQPGATANTSSTSNNANWLIEVNGAFAGDDQDGFETHVARIFVRGLRIANFSGFGVKGLGDGGRVSGCFIYSNRWGVRILGNEGARVGGLVPADLNVISANQDIGVLLDDGGKTNQVIGNFIGPDTTGTTNLGNQNWGVVIQEGTWGSTIGEPHSAANTIAYNSAGGVKVADGTNNLILGNRIFSNGGPGIVLGPFGAGPNDVGDADVGANQLQNFPIITNVVTGFGTVIQGRLNSRPNKSYSLYFYANTQCDVSGYGEGERYLGGVSVITDSNGDVNFDVIVSSMLPGQYLTATATDPFGNTSEFSLCQLAEARPTTNTVVNTNDSGPGSLRQALLDADQDAATNIIVFNIPGNGLKIIRPLSRLSISEPAIIDGFTQPGASPNTVANGNNANWLIELDGSFLDNFSTGLGLGRNVVLRGLRISNSPGHGVHVHENCVVKGCFIYNNQFDGIHFDDDAENVLIGGVTPADRNIISGNLGHGITFDGGIAHRVLGNWIGTDLTGTGNFGNQGWGVLIQFTSSHIGGTNAGEANVIAFNHSGGVHVLSSENSIRGNKIFSNGGLGIDLFPSGVSVNDIGDSDVGANQLQNFPLITNVIIGSITTAIQGWLNSQSNTQYALDFYGNNEGDISGHGEGARYLGSASITTDGTGNGTFDVTLPFSLGDFYVTATATDPLGNTSEFSPSWPQPLSLGFTKLFSEGYELILRNVDGSPIVSERLSGIGVLAATNLSPQSVWEPIPNSLELTNGEVRVLGLELTNSIRFFRGVEQRVPVPP